MQNNNTQAVRLMLEAGWPVDTPGENGGDGAARGLGSTAGICPRLCVKVHCHGTRIMAVSPAIRPQADGEVWPSSC
jgi:hypothetical protein